MDQVEVDVEEVGLARRLLRETRWLSQTLSARFVFGLVAVIMVGSSDQISMSTTVTFSGPLGASKVTVRRPAAGTHEGLAER